MRTQAALCTAGFAIIELIGAVVISAIVSQAAMADTDLRSLTGRPDVQARLLEIGKDVRSSFDSVADMYAREAAEQPYDPVVYIERCRFLARVRGTVRVRRVDRRSL
jgi:hypothetical protein